METAGAQSPAASYAWFVVAALILVLALLAGGLIALKLFVADNLPNLTESELEEARSRWERNGPASYDVDIEIGGRQPGVVHVEVRDGVVTAALRDGRPTPDWTWDEWSVAGQFDTLERELEMAADPQANMGAPPGAELWLRCEFDPKFGFPRRYHRYATSGATEVSWRTISFEPK